MKPPITIKIKTDGNELKFIEEKKGFYYFKYTKSKTKKGEILSLNEEQLNKILKHNEQV